MEAELVRSNIRGGRQLARSSTGIMDLWKKQSIYRAPAHMKDLNPKAYTPQLVSIGPYHYGKPHLLAMEEHKTRALQRFLDRTKKNFMAYRSALSPLTDELMESYQQLGEEWKGDTDRFLQLMVFDGSFLYEYMRGVSKGWDGYDEQDPIFSNHALPNICPYVLPDILMLENQLPLLVIERLIAVETDQLSQQEESTQSRKGRHHQSIHCKSGGGLMAPSKHGSKQGKGKGLVIELGEEEHLRNI